MPKLPEIFNQGGFNASGFQSPVKWCTFYNKYFIKNCQKALLHNKVWLVFATWHFDPVAAVEVREKKVGEMRLGRREKKLRMMLESMCNVFSYKKYLALISNGYINMKLKLISSKIYLEIHKSFTLLFQIFLLVKNPSQSFQVRCSSYILVWHGVLWR